MSRTIQRYGWKPSLPDHRDFKASLSGLSILDEVDPRGQMPRVWDQGQLGSCTANAVAACIEYDRHLDGHPWRTPSRLMIYYGERMLEGSLANGDTGAMGRDGFKFAQTYGWVREGRWPYDISQYQVRPPDDLWTAALNNRLTKSYVSVPQTIEGIKSVLSNKQTVAFGFTVYDSFESSAVLKSGVVPMPGANESTLGGHEVLAVGYFASLPNYVLVRNSWGSSFYTGQVPGAAEHGGGYFLMPWKYITDPGLAGDLRTIVRPL